MALPKRFSLIQGALFLLLSAVLALPAAAAIEDDDEPLDLAPVVKGETKRLPTPTPEPARPTAVPTKAPAAAPTAAPTPVPKPVYKPPRRSGTTLTGLDVNDVSGGTQVVIRGNGSVIGSTSVLSNPPRLLVKIQNARLGSGVDDREINRGALQRVRLSQKSGEVWMVLDLARPVSHSTQGNIRNGYGVTVKGAAQAPAVGSSVRPGMANLPKSTLMLFDKNVLFEGKQYDRFACANFIYDKSDQFPLNREFDVTMVFFDGYGAFVGNLRILDPNGQVVAQTRQPFAFNLFNKLTDYSVSVPFSMTFAQKGYYTMYLTLNGEDVKTHRFYVGHNDDQVP